jgi:hypothetical protein
MPFLIPAVSAALCDFTILYLGRNASVAADSEWKESSHVIYHVGYMFITAAMRLFLLVVPLPYHSYNGTALKCPRLYQLLYGCTFLVLSLHMLSLSMIDPSSLSSLVPSQSPPDTHDQIARYLWLMLALSLIADLCHILLFLHVRSTAPSDDELLQGRPRVLFYFVKEQEDTERDSLLRQQHKMGQRCSSESSSRMQRLSNNFVHEVHTRLSKAKDEWTKRLDDYTHVRSGAGGSNGGQDHLLQKPLTPFRVLLQLFAYEEVLTNGRLNAVYDQDDGAALMNFVPQLLSFLLHGAYESSPRLEEWILETCRRNVYFAHRCYWFLRAWSLETNNTGDGLPARLSQSSSLTSFDSLNDSATLSATDNKFLPEERAVIEELLHRVMKCGEEPARILNFGTGLEMEMEMSESSSQTASSNMDGSNSSPSALMFAAEAGSLPVDPNTGMPSPRHWDCIAATKKFGFLPLDRALTNQKQTINGVQTSCFDATPVFMDALLTMADNLFRVAREHRTEEFRRQLQLLEVQALPSNTIYIPLQEVNHRVWRIVADESIAINTKERVPCIVCLEVVEYARDEVTQTRDVRKLLERVAPSETQITLPDLKNALSERELTNRWRYGHRDPHRRDTAFEKLAHSVQRGIRNIPLNQMKTSVQAQIDKLRETKPDFWTLTVPDTFDDKGETSDTEQLHTLDPTPRKDIERGEPDQPSSPSSKDSTHTPTPFIPASPKSSPALAKKTTMGQWSSPNKTDDRPARETPVDLDHLLVPPPLNHVSYQRMENGGSTAPSKPSGHRGLNGCLPKYVNKENDGEAKYPSQPNGKPPTKPPPVVFKENWKEKEERLRSHSAFGSHPGWRLVPILIKANDDLRQEQLASQLIYRMAVILARERVPVWLCPYEILAITLSGGIIEAIPDTISIASLKKNDPNFTSLRGFFNSYFEDPDDLADAKANFCESLAAYSIVCFLLQIKDRHNGNILLDNRGHLVHIDFGFFFLSSPGKNTGFESAPFKLTREFVEVLDGPDSRLFRIFRLLCYRAFIALRRHCMEIILLVEMLKKGNEDLPCFRGRPDDAIKELRHRFRLDLNDRACVEYVNALIDESLENWRTNWYDRYQRYCVGVL